MSFSKTATLTVTKTAEITADVEVSWIEGETGTEPEIPTGYERASEFDMDYGVAGYLYAYKKIT